MTQQKTRTWPAVWRRVGLAALSCAWLAACASSTGPDQGVDGESHFLTRCDPGCPSELACVDGVCTQPCDDDDVCEPLHASASCIEDRCDLACAGNADCGTLAGAACVAGYCRVVTTGPGDGPDSAFLQHCTQSCPDGLTCRRSACTLACVSDVACAELSPAASCVGLVDPGQEPMTDPHCGVPCDSHDACQALGEGFACADGSCRAAPSGGPTNRPGRQPCDDAQQCASGICQGMGCGDDTMGLCADATEGCSDDAVTYCGCDGNTFIGSGSCPGRRFASIGQCGQEACRAEGRYQAGKEGSYQPCCGGLTEVFWQVPATETDGTPVCTEPVGHREYACVLGTCGDGMCEAGEDGACGCMADCPGAVWGTQGTRPAGSPCSSDDDCVSGVCEGEGCGTDQLGQCAPSDRVCTDDIATYCDCNGAPFTSSGSCPGQRFLKRGPC